MSVQHRRRVQGHAWSCAACSMRGTPLHRPEGAGRDVHALSHASLRSAGRATRHEHITATRLTSRAPFLGLIT